jgi:hypothetical protein
MKYECWAFLFLFKKYEIKIEDEKLKHSELFSMFMESIESIINEYKNKDMEVLLEDSKKKENEAIEMQERIISFPTNHAPRASPKGFSKTTRASKPFGAKFK